MEKTATTKKPAAAKKSPAAPRKAAAPKAGKITQTKPTLAEGLANPNHGIADIGKGSVRETAPAVRAGIGNNKRVVQQGDDVILHTRSPIMGQTEVLASVIKVNQDATIAVRVPNNGYGRHEDFTGVLNKPSNGEFWWSWPEGSENLDDERKAEEAAKPEPAEPIVPPPAPVDPATAPA